jgi:hypothetical protein
MQKEILVSSIRSTGDLAGVFEYDGKTGYFYLYRTKDHGGTRIIDSLHIISGLVDFARDDISIQWDDAETKVALFVNKAMWAVFDCTLGQKFGGGYGIGRRPAIPASITFVKSPR